MSLCGCLAFVRFETPGYLVLLALLPLLVVFSFRSLAGLGPLRRWIAIGMRCLVVACMVLALAGAQWTRKTDELAVVFLVDRSESVPRSKQLEAFKFLEHSKGEMRRKKDRLGVIAFDGRAAVEQLPMNELGIEQISEPIDPDQTDLAAAMRMALALFTDDAARRLVVLSDGNENVGAALEEADQYAAAGVPIDVVPLRYRHRDEVVFERLSAPPTAKAEETINLQMVLRSRSDYPVRGRILLYHNEQLVDLDSAGPGAGFAVTLDPGPNRLTIPIPLRVAGAHRFKAVFEPDDTAADTIPGNNEGRAFTVVSGQGRILVLTPGEGEGPPDDWDSAQLLASALERERLVCDVEVVGETPLDQVRLLEYSAVILSNVSADKLAPEERQGLAVYVRDLGGGLIMVGGDESFGAGGWMDTPVEEVMPVSFDVKSKRQIPKGALVLVLHACEIPQGNYWGERVAIAAVKTLSSRDLVGVISYRWQGGDQQYWDYPLGPVGDKTQVIRHIKKMRMGDLPDLDPPLRSAVDALAKRGDAAVKHIIVTSDFDCALPRGDLIKKMKKYGITCSTVALGPPPHTNLRAARRLANDTGGRYYATQNYAKLPQIFIKESRIVRRSLINENPFTPRLVSALPTTVAGLAGEPIPQLGGYVVTTAKPLAQVPLVRATQDNEADPVLAHWQVGLGKAVAFTSGMWTRWGAQWVEWPKFSKFWAQLVRWASRQSAAAAFDVTTSTRGGKGKIRIDALDKNAAAINFMNIEGTLVKPNHESEPLHLTQTGPGVYEGEFEARAAGSYVASFSYRLGSGTDAVSGTLQTGLSVAFSPEYRELETNEALLSELAERTGGRVLTPAEAPSAFDTAGLPPAEARRPIWEYLLRWMLLLFLLDVAVRRIAINPIEIGRTVRRFIGEMAGKRQPAEA
ncbi:MAG: glutamine amidotransferase, partial [Phycisphaerae bacterium]